MIKAPFDGGAAERHSWAGQPQAGGQDEVAD
jgi:hypothetical protein